jgi:hypothetical protein
MPEREPDKHDWRPPVSIDLARPCSGRVYAAWLGGADGGKDTFTVDRELAARIAARSPQTPQSARNNRAFLARAVTEIVQVQGIAQIIDIGAGLPTRQNTHQIAQAIDPSTRVVYVDNDPQIIVHARALLAYKGMPTGVTQADLRDPEGILADPELRALIDLTKPVGLLLVAIGHFLHNDADPHYAYRIVDRLVAALPPGSFVAVSHLTAEGVGEEVAREAVEMWREANPDDYPVTRTREEIGRFLHGLELLEPGVVPVDQWRPATPDAKPMEKFWLYAAVARKT